MYFAMRFPMCFHLIRLKERVTRTILGSEKMRDNATFDFSLWYHW